MSFICVVFFKYFLDVNFRFIGQMTKPNVYSTVERKKSDKITLNTPEAQNFFLFFVIFSLVYVLSARKFVPVRSKLISIELKISNHNRIVE